MEEGTELESVPLYNGKDVSEADTESEDHSSTSGLQAPDLLDQGNWGLIEDIEKPSESSRRNPPPDLLQGEQEQQAC